MSDRPARSILCLALLALATAAPAQTYVNTLVSRTAAGVQGNGASSQPVVTPDGRYVAFESLASNLAVVDGHGVPFRDIFVKDLQTGAVTMVSLSDAGVQGNEASFDPTISADGRFVAFRSQASNLVPGDTNGMGDIFVRDLQAGTTVRASLTSAGTEGTGNSQMPFITPDGRYVAFSSESDLVPVWKPGVYNIFVRDLQTGTTTLESMDADLESGEQSSSEPVLTPDGRYVAFVSGSNELVPGDTNLARDVFVRDRLLGTVDRASLDILGQEQPGDCHRPAISDDGRFVAFSTHAFLHPDDNNLDRDVYVRDRVLGVTRLVTPFSDGAIFSSLASWEPAISADGRWVAFQSDSYMLVSGDTNDFRDLFLHDLLHGVTQRVTYAFTGAQTNEISSFPEVSPDARRIVFESKATNLVAGDTNAQADVFLLDVGPWANAGSALAGVSGAPLLVGHGTLQGASAGDIALSAAAPVAAAVLFVSLTAAPAPVPFKGGSLVAFPVIAQLPVVTGASGNLTLPFLWPTGLPAGLHLDFQYAIQDAAAVKGVALSNALDALTP